MLTENGKYAYKSRWPKKWYHIKLFQRNITISCRCLLVLFIHLLQKWMDKQFLTKSARYQKHYRYCKMLKHGCYVTSYIQNNNNKIVLSEQCNFKHKWGLRNTTRHITWLRLENAATWLDITNDCRIDHNPAAELSSVKYSEAVGFMSELPSCSTPVHRTFQPIVNCGKEFDICGTASWWIRMNSTRK